MNLDEIKKILKMGASSVVITENQKPVYVIMEYSFFEKMIPTGNRESKSIETDASGDLVQNLTLEELEEGDVADVSGERGVKFDLSDLPV